MNPAHKPTFSPFVSHSAFVHTHYSIMYYERFMPLSPPQHTSSARSHPAKSTSDWRHVYTSFGTPAVLGDNSSHHSLHPSLREPPVVPSISVTSPDHSLLEHYRQKAYHCDSEYTPAIAMSPHHITGTGNSKSGNYSHWVHSEWKNLALNCVWGPSFVSLMRNSIDTHLGLRNIYSVDAW
jgi:hypothetical protein